MPMNGTDNDIKIQIKIENICDIHVNLKLGKRAIDMVKQENHRAPSRKWRKRETKGVKIVREREKVIITPRIINAAIQDTHFHSRIKA